MTTPRTLTQLFFHAIDRFATKRAALRYKAEGEWLDITHHEMAREVKQIGLGLRELGVNPGDRVAILSNNRPEWAIADFACLTIGCADVSVYPSLTPHQIQYILKDSGATAIFVEDAGQLEKVTQIQESLPNLRHVVVFHND